MLLLHVATESDWAAAQAAGSYDRSTYGRSLAEVGFVHCCATWPQLDGVLARFYADVREPLIVLVIDSDRLTSRWQLEDVPGAAEPFPHVYGPIDLSAVVEIEPLPTTRR